MELKNGTKIRYKKNGENSRLRGKTGRIIDQNTCDYLIEFTENIGGHNGNNQGKNEHCWWTKKNNIELFPTDNKIKKLKEEIQK